MKKFLICFMVPLLLWACNEKKEIKKTTEVNAIRVGIFDTNGDSPGCITDAYEALRIDSLIQPEVIGAATIMSEAIFDYDLILFPGGSGKPLNWGSWACSECKIW